MLTHVADGVLVHRSELLRNNTVVVQGRSGGVLVVDPGITDGEMACLADDLSASGRHVAAGFATHPDWDHVLWHPELGEAPRYGTARCAAFLRDLLSDPDWLARVAEGLPPEIAGEMTLDLFGRITGLPAGTAELPWDGPRVRIIEHPAHAPGHAALLIAERTVLVAGDMLSDVFIPMLDDPDPHGSADPVEDYLAGLNLLQAVADGVEVVIPGHGSVGGPGQVHARIELDRAYLHALRDGRAPDDPRISTSAEPGWEWVGDIHEGQAQSLARRGEHRGTPGP
ncbi:MBL fold metallo-hydrolase [Blastococcus tunisiensis]|uniref:Glyoxylase, beta-lactamase superfamily II n=1 Tax=Blastococcus tunisiensis TaxID=1798228 RepID=A0A1I2JZ03_9ACTN|nr:MBL fold metallo-hydrolase [Blastococcus sp. DSM 46838]SFF58167.1 Glyoxylase, beta-lactamase superfamily II [Blastococcus sp. DSM 46838]